MTERDPRPPASDERREPVADDRTPARDERTVRDERPVRDERRGTRETVVRDDRRSASSFVKRTAKAGLWMIIGAVVAVLILIAVVLALIF